LHVILLIAMDCLCLTTYKFENPENEHVEILVPHRVKAEPTITKFLSQQRDKPSLSRCFVIERKVWKSKTLHEHRMQGRIHELLSGRKGGRFALHGKTGVFGNTTSSLGMGGRWETGYNT
jgi:hypothetical protein